ncbi:hypothetical protein PIB30_075569, partial [Stylosanthes scabra]|nr:hypothetical protein [Stylosanthes scabra]
MGKLEHSRDVFQNFRRLEQRTFSVFVDYLNYKVNIEWLWNVFSRVGQVVDVYISKKVRRNNPTRFAFVRFGFKNYASRVVQLLNGSLLDGKTIAVSEAKYGRSEIRGDSGKHSKAKYENFVNYGNEDTKVVWDVKERGGMSYKDAVANSIDKATGFNKLGGGMKGTKPDSNDGKDNNASSSKMGCRGSDRRKIEVSSSLKQKELLNRSILAESVKPIKFGSVVQGFKRIANDYGRLECRDLGPNKCIISFTSVELRDKALTGSFMPEFFDKVRLLWGTKWNISRRVWLELLGLPIHVWSEDTFARIARGLDGRVKQHELTEEGASFSVARILVDCYQREPIQEWISISCEDVDFEVYVKEVGGEVLSLQVHPEDSISPSGSCSTCRVQVSREASDENSPVNEGTLMEKDVDPLIEGAINEICELEQVWGGIKLHTSVDEDMLDPMEVEAQIKPHNSHDCWGLRALFHENGDVDESQSSTSCPFPPGFGPCTKENHVHKDIQIGGNSLDEESDDVLLKNLISKSDNKKAKGSRPKKAKAPQPQRILLGPAKRIFQSRLGTCKEGVKFHRDMSNKENEGPTTQRRSQNKSQDKGKRTDCIEEHVESERLDEDVEKAKEAIYLCKDA